MARPPREDSVRLRESSDLLQGECDVPVRLFLSDPSRCPSARPYLLERNRRRFAGCVRAPPLSRPRLHCGGCSRHHLFRDGVDHISAKLLVRRTRPALPLLAGAWDLRGDLRHRAFFCRHLRRLQPARPVPAIAGGAEERAMVCGLDLCSRRRLQRDDTLDAAVRFPRCDRDRRQRSRIRQGHLLLSAGATLV